MIKATLSLYSDCTRDAVQALIRSPIVLVGLLLVGATLGVLSPLLVGSLGIAGGFLVGFLSAGAAGWYLALVELGVSGRRPVRFSDLADQVGVHIWDVISVLFIFWIGELLLSAVPPLLAVVTLVAVLVFNPAPEMIYQERSRSVELLGDAAKFMQSNWPEWLGVHVVAAVVLGAWAMLLTGGDFSLRTGISLLQVFGPWFGFMQIGQMAFAIGQSDLIGLVAALLLLAFTHFFMLFRGFLYKRLSGSSRRSRAWASRI